MASTINMQNMFKIGFFVAVAAVIGLLILRGRTQGDKLYIDTLQANIEALENDRENLNKVITSLYSKNEMLKDSVLLLEQETSQLEKKRTATIKYYEKKIRDIDSYTVTELDSFFIARYPSPQVEGN